MKKNHVRLSAFIKPSRYELFIKPDLNGFVFEGEETIFLELIKPTSEITLHAKELDVHTVNFKVKNEDFKVKNGGVRYDGKNETVTFLFGKKLPKGGES